MAVLVVSASLAVAGAVAPAASADRIDWQAVEQALGHKGDVKDGVFKATFPRTDVDVRVGDVKVAPGLALGSWVAFQPAGAGAMLMGDLVLLGPEVGTVAGRLAGSPVDVTAVHNHLQGETPPVWYMHVGGHGDPVELARAIRRALDATRPPLRGAVQESPSTAGGTASPAPEGGRRDLNQAAIEQALGWSGEKSGELVKFSIPRAERIQMYGTAVPPSMGVATAINFQPAPNGAATTGDFVLRAEEVKPVLAALAQHGIRVTALHNHMLEEEPRLFFMHFWGTGDPAELAAGLKAALSKMNVARETKG